MYSTDNLVHSFAKNIMGSLGNTRYLGTQQALAANVFQGPAPLNQITHTKNRTLVHVFMVFFFCI